MCERVFFVDSQLWLSIVQVFGAEENDNAIFFLFVVIFAKLYQRPRAGEYDINNRRLSNGKMLCEQMREFTDDTKLYYILCLTMTDSPSENVWATWRVWTKDESSQDRKKNIIVLKKFIKYEHKPSQPKNDMNQYA